MDPTKIVALIGGIIAAVLSLGGVALTLGRILQKLDDLGKKVDASLDPEKGVIRELRERTHDANNRDQELVNKMALVEQRFTNYQREVEREFATVRREIHIDEQLEQIKTLLRGRTPAHGVKPSE